MSAPIIDAAADAPTLPRGVPSQVVQQALGKAPSSQPSVAIALPSQRPVTAHEPVKTQQMAMPAAPAADLDAAHSFVISLATAEKERTAAAPLPQVSADTVSKGHRTQVLALNNKIGWAGEIGDDAEMLALLKATGAHPASGRRTLLAAGVVVVVAAVLVFAAAGDDIALMIKRAASGTKAEPGIVIVKTVPSGADVVLDGKSKGRTNMKIQGVDTNEAHRLVVKPKDKDAIIIEFEKKDFVEGEGGWPTYVFERDFTPPKVPAVPEESDK